MMRVALMYSAQAGPRATIDIHALARGADEPMRHSVEPRAMAFIRIKLARGPTSRFIHLTSTAVSSSRGRRFASSRSCVSRHHFVSRVPTAARSASGTRLGWLRGRHGKGLAHHASRTDPVTLPNFVVDHCLGETMVPRRGPTKTSVVNGLECPTEATRTIAFQQLLSELSHRTWRNPEPQRRPPGATADRIARALSRC